MTRRIRVASRLLCLALPLTMIPAAQGAMSHPAAHQRPRLTGFDGLTYESAPPVVPGQDGELFYGPDFDFACGLGGTFAKAVGQLGRLSRLIERSGRRVVYTIAPNKSSVFPARLDDSLLPQGECDLAGLRAQHHILDAGSDPSYLPLRRRLARSPHQTYWKTDAHWTSVGGSVFAKSLATKLDPRLGRKQKYTYGTDTRVGMLNQLQGLSVTETSEMAYPAGPVQVRTARGSEPWAGYPDFIDDYSWVSSPSSRTWPGHTLLLGDSFTWYGLADLLPIFRQGRFLWFTLTPLRKVARAIAQADTIVIEVVQVFTNGTVIGNKEFRAQVRKALGRSAPPSGSR